MRYTKDKLGRAKFTPHTQSPHPDFVANKHHTAWMLFLNLHGPLSSEYLYQYTIERIGNRHNFSEALKALYDGGMVYKPIQQRSTEYPDGHFHVYDLTQKGEDYLRKKGLLVDALRPTGKWVHQFMVSTITATIHIMCGRKGCCYIPPHAYLADNSLSYPVPFNWQDGSHTLSLIPDAVFAIDYGGGSFIAYFLEADRNTEAHKKTVKWNRKSDLRSIRQYGNFIGKKLYKKAYQRDARAVMLFITVAPGHAANFLDLVAEELGSPHYVAVGVQDAFQEPFYPPKLLEDLFEGDLARAGREPFRIQKEDPA